MAESSIVRTCNAELLEQMEDAIRVRHDPRLISLLKTMVKLTSSPDQLAKMEAAEEAAQPKCQHEVVNRRTGKCVACGEVPEED
jgi:hypothetical protein